MMHFNANAQAPVFTGGHSQTIMVCQDVAPWDITSTLAVNDATAGGPIDSWDIVSAPLHGTLSGFPGSAPTNLTIIVSGSPLFYQPAAGFNGNDVFTVYVTNNTTGLNDTTVVNVVVNQLPSMVIGSSPVVCQGATSTSLSFGSLSNIGPIRQVFPYTGSTLPLTIPSGITSVAFDVQGGSGGANNVPGAVANPGLGGRVQGNLAVVSGSTLYITAGGQGQPGGIFGATGGYNGGGNASYYPPVGCGGAGGGASDIRVGGMSLNNRVVVAGGGGGNGWDSPYGSYFGGAGGNLIGGSSQPNVGGSPATGGTQVSGGMHSVRGGWTSGTDGTLGNGGDGSMLGGVAGGGGGGYYGGGGGVWNGGAGGSSYSDAFYTSLVSYTSGYNSGDGIVSITYNIPGNYTMVINWPSGAVTTTDVLPTGGSFPVSIPAGTAAGTYSGTITINNSTCTSPAYSFNVTVNATPDVTLSSIPSQAVCNGGTTAAVNFSGSVSGTTFNWVNDNTTFGLMAGGSTDIAATTVSNPSVNPMVAHITVTPTASGCDGLAQVFNITANPTPMIPVSSLTPSDVCNTTLFNYSPNSLTAGATYNWNRDVIAGISTGTSSGSGSVSETLTNITNAPVGVVYTYTTTANGCSSTQNVTFNVNPSISLSSTLDTTICNSTAIDYVPTSSVAGTTYNWLRNITTGITNPPAPGTGDITETLNNVTSGTINVIYTYTMWANGCMNAQNVTVRVNPTATLNSESMALPLCSGDMFNYTASSATPGASLNWSMVPAAGVYTTGATSGTGNINEVLVNNSGVPVMVTYNYTASVGGCDGPVMAVRVLVNPATGLASSHHPSAICNNTTFSYSPSSIAGTTFTWIRPTVSGISNSPAYGSGDINETLINTTSNPVMVPYVFNVLSTSTGCTGSDTVWATVNPTPSLTSTLIPAGICDSGKFNYNPTSNVSGATFNWSRAYVAGIVNAPASGSGNPMEALVNSTNVNVDVVYRYTVVANGCSSIPADVTVTVHPIPRLSSGLTGTICTGDRFTYTPSSFAPNVVYDWTRPLVNGLSPFTGFGTGGVSEVLVNSTSEVLQAIYLYRLSAYGCANPKVYEVVLTVNPAPAPVTLSAVSNNVCSNTNSQIVTASHAPQTGVSYIWDATGATIVTTSETRQAAVLDFPNPGTATIYLTSKYVGTGCKGTTSMDVNVLNGVADNPQVIYYMGMFVCLQNDEDTYQWGYDDAHTLASTSFNGAVNQSYSQTNVDFTNNNYWVITTHNGCTQKTYYNAPKANGTGHREAGIGVNIYPNPVTDNINLELTNSTSGEMVVEVLNMLGQKLITSSTTETRAVISASSLVPGGYLINCYLNGAKVATSRFIKN